MTVSTKPVDLVRPTVGLPPPLDKGLNAQGTGFRDAMMQALQDTSSLQKESGRLTRGFQLETSTASLEETVLAGVKSNIAFQATLQVRNRVVQAYTDVMNMQV
ncbi:flagellar hook-basal body complex protein FliE [Rhodoferax sp.]|uniref:flagellar hook-basal body complex protein FliE n=1 Tax=Rhodoferax sp. TaxID=50421 RepID=UPI0027764FD0|nr:flagellar hook-basal body complex protein FliE [Rhodoferax sp.]